MEFTSVDPRVIIPTASLACYVIYKRYEPTDPLLNFLLLVGAPSALTLVVEEQATLLGVLRVLLAYWALLVLFTTAYRLSPFHPLAQFPGPTVAKVSKLYHVYMVLRGDPHIIIREWHDKYGDVVRIGPNELTFKRADAVYPILGARQLKKGPFYNIRVTEEGLPIDAIKDFDQHTIRRKPWTRALAPAALKDYEEIILTKTELLMEKLTERVGQDIDISAWMSYYSFDFMGKLAFAREFGMMNAGRDTEGLWHMMDTAVLALASLSVIPWIVPALKALPGAGNSVKRFQRIASTYGTHRVSTGSKSKDLWYYLMGEDGARQNADLQYDVTADAFTAVIAGSDTVATALSHFWYLMMRYPKCCERLCEEVDRTFPHGELPYDYNRLAEMPYLNACLNESMRVISPVLSGLQRRVELGSGGTMIGPQYVQEFSYFPLYSTFPLANQLFVHSFVPEGTNVSVHMTSLYHNPDTFSPLPDTFWPDRWLDQVSYDLPNGTSIPKREIKLDRASFVPFSVGQQSCPGKNLAWLQLRCIVALVMQRFRIKPAESYDLDRWEKETRDAHATLRGSLVVRLEMRT
ncbi:cytochrome P450 [Irpex rosettiformis]|uniref:Cytochrome P450 n=1 Tax=Irpex rosettiformis TaxID=378272 RepID=A0ACB8UHF1_9APHY|nr:cytochrome P450 [Irpex rosettiformis]